MDDICRMYELYLLLRFLFNLLLTWHLAARMTTCRKITVSSYASLAEAKPSVDRTLKARGLAPQASAYSPNNRIDSVRFSFQSIIPDEHYICVIPPILIVYHSIMTRSGNYFIQILC